MDIGLSTLEFELQTPEYKLQTSDRRLQTPERFKRLFFQHCFMQTEVLQTFNIRSPKALSFWSEAAAVPCKEDKG